MSRNPHEPTDRSRAEVSALASFGVYRKNIASCIGIVSDKEQSHG